MEWRIIVPVLCLIGILHVRGNAAQSNSNTSTINNNTITEGTTNSTANANQTESTNPNATVSQTASSNATATATASQTASSNTNATTNPSATATPTPANTASLNLVFKLTQTFKPVFSDLNNPETKQLADEITNAFSPVYRKQFANFRRMFIRKFSAGSVVTDSVLEFDNTNASPNLTEVKNTFADAITAGNVNITVDITSISVSNITTTNVTTNPTATVSQTASSNATATASQTASSNTNATTNPSATTLQSTTPATTVSTSAATIPTPANTASLNLVFKLTQTFKPVFSDLNNPETKQLADEITNAFSPVYRKQFANFRRMFIRKFSAGSVVTDSVLEFDNTNASPNLTEVKNTFADAITAGNVNITVDITSISVSNITTTNVTTNPTATVSQTASSNATATASQTASSNTTATTNPSATTLQSTTPATTVSTSAATIPTPANTASLNLVFKLTQTFKPAFSDLNNPETKQLADEITNAFSPVYRKQFANFRRMFIRKFSAGSVVTDSVLEFDNTNASPNLTEVKNTFADAITAGNVNITVDITSISVSNITTTNVTTNPTATANQTASSNTTATANQTASSNTTATANQTASSNTTATANQTASSNTTATANQTASSNTTATTNLSATTLQSTTPATTVSTSAATIPTPANTASLNLVFKLTQTFKPVFSDLNNPETKQLADEITNAFTPVYRKRFANFRRMFIRKFSAGSVVTDSVLEFDNTNASPNLTEVKNTFVDAITAGGFNFTVDNTSISVSDITTTNATTQATTIVSTTAGFNLSDYNVTFTMNETFSSELSNISSSRAVALAKNITAQFDGVFKKLFTNFVRSLIWRFRNGSIIVDALLGFDKTGSSPTAAEVVKVIVASAKNGTFTFTVNSLSVTDPSGVTANRSPVLASMMTALWMTLASLVVSAVMH